MNELEVLIAEDFIKDYEKGVLFDDR